MPTIEVRRILADRSRGGVFVNSAGERIEVLRHADHELREQAAWWRSKTQHYRKLQRGSRPPSTVLLELTVAR